MEENAALRWIILSITPLPYIELTFAALSSTSTRLVVFPRRLIRIDHQRRLCISTVFI
jgi:hypothetical protein